jgi:hypothetical protein
LAEKASFLWHRPPVRVTITGCPEDNGHSSHSRAALCFRQLPCKAWSREPSHGMLFAKAVRTSGREKERSTKTTGAPLPCLAMYLQYLTPSFPSAHRRLSTSHQHPPLTIHHPPSTIYHLHTNPDLSSLLPTTSSSNAQRAQGHGTTALSPPDARKLQQHDAATRSSHAND